MWISNSPVRFILPILFGAALIGVCAFENSKVIRSRSFVPAKAILTEVHHQAGKRDSRFFYEGTLVDSGMKFRSSRVSYGNINSDETYSEIIKSYPTGRSLEVLVSQDFPVEVILRRSDLSGIFVAILIAGVVIFAAGLFGFMKALLARQKA